VTESFNYATTFNREAKSASVMLRNNNNNKNKPVMKYSHETEIPGKKSQWNYRKML
jgi:hypothetical protein